MGDLRYVIEIWMKLQEALLNIRLSVQRVKQNMHRQQKWTIKRSEAKKYNTHNNVVSESNAILRFVSIDQSQTTTDEGKW